MNQIDIQHLLPHRPPFVMVNIWIEPSRELKISYTIPQEHFFLEDGYFNEAGIIEHMAQSAGVENAYQELKNGASNSQPRLGYIASLNQLTIYDRPKAGATIHSHITLLHKVLNTHVVFVKTFCEETLIAQTEMKIFISQADF